MNQRKLVWLGSSHDDLKELADSVRRDLGFALYQAELGCFPKGAKPLSGFNGVIEIIKDFDGDTFRAVYATKIGENIYVLHVFKKKSKHGIKTPKKEIELIKQRLKTAKRLEEMYCEHTDKTRIH